VEPPLATLNTRLGVSVMQKSKKRKSGERNSLDTLYRKRDTALERVVAIWEKSDVSKEDPDELDRALDVLTLAHTAATFEFVGGPHKW
jgi:hypothetical protein